MKLFPWAKYTSTKGGIKLHTALDLQLALPVVMNMTNAKVHDSKATREIIDSLPPFSVVVMDRGYNDYSLCSVNKNSPVSPAKRTTRVGIFDVIKHPDKYFRFFLQKTASS